MTDKKIIGLMKAAGNMLDSHAVPKGFRSAWMNKKTFMFFGGTEDAWDSFPGDGEYKLISDSSQSHTQPPHPQSP